MNRAMLFRRLLLSLAAGILIGALISEVSFRLLGTGETRPPQRIELVIPAGTAERVSRGESTPSLPADMSFVVGDTLAVVNRDSSGHTLGPLFVPAGATGTLTLDLPERLAYTCSFQPSRYLNLDVQEPLTFGTRLYGILLTGLPLGVLIAIYAIIGLPAKKGRA